MDKKLLIDDYLQGKHPIEQEKWELPTESELDRDEELYDALLDKRKRAPLLWRGRGRLLFAAAAVLAIVFALFTWKSLESQKPSQPVETMAEVVVPETPTLPSQNDDTSPEVSRHVAKPLTTRRKTSHDTSNPKPPQPALAEATAPSSENVVPTNAADSLYYYLTQLEDQMGDCRDSTCFAELGNLIQADERIKGLVQKIIHKQVETAYQEEYLVDTTTRHIPL